MKTCKFCGKKKKIEKGWTCATCKKERGRSSAWYRRQAVAKAKIIAKKRDNHICQRCGKDGREYQIHGSHVYSEGAHPNMSADPLNIKALCAQCHMWWHENPIESFVWFKERFPERYAYLKMKSLESIKINWQTYSPIEASVEAIEIIRNIG